MNSPAFNPDRSVSQQSHSCSHKEQLSDGQCGDSQSVLEKVRPGENEGSLALMHLL